MVMVECGVYKIINLTNDKLYVGSSVNLKNRKKIHFLDLKKGTHHNNYLQKSFDKYGEKNFTWEIIELVEFDDNRKILKKNLLEKEQFWINELIIKDGVNIGYNICLKAGSCLGIKLSEEHKKKLSDSKKGDKNPCYGKVYSEEEKLKLREWSLNMSEESRKKISDSSKGNKYRLNQKPSDETKKKMSESQKGKHSSPRKFTEESKKRLIDALKNRVITKETREKRSKSMMGKNKKK
jgi:hypothetical protein